MKKNGAKAPLSTTRFPRCPNGIQGLDEIALHGLEKYASGCVILLDHRINDQSLAIPAVVRKLPRPVSPIVGSLSGTSRVLVGLDLRSSE